MLSSFSIISLIGVMLGVLVLVVVMAVYAGLERNVKGRILGFTPHVLLTKHDPTAPDSRLVEWKEEAEKAKKLPTVEAATAYVSDNVIVDVASWQRPVLFRGIDTADPAQVQGITNMLDLKKHPDSTADLGIDDRVVISSMLADQLAIGVGDKVRLYSTRNFGEVMEAYKATERPPVREAFAEVWEKSTKTLIAGWLVDGEKFTLTFPIYREIYSALFDIHEEKIREPERALLKIILESMDQSEKDDTKEVFRFDAASKTEIEKTITELNQTDAEKMDADTLKGLKSVVLPKEAYVVGVYQASQMAVTPDLFVPLPLAQDLAGLDDAVQGISIRLTDAYRADEFAAETMPKLNPEIYSLTTWSQQYQAFFSLIEQQRGMMYFTLFFIVLISAFSMMAVMFTVTIQKRREIGVMKALGAAPSQIIRVFLYQGMILGTLGAILGVGLGRLVIHFRGQLQAALRTVGFDPFSSSLTGFDILPAHNDPVEQAGFALMAFILCSLAALVPAFFAARSDAAKSLRNL
ncbi:MAG: ABC transporter permease [Akkermansiaceae bacterium]|nr:ABC transporter permease [Akkermansiaceae bacterium]